MRRDGYTARRALKRLDLSFADVMDGDRKGSRGFPKSALLMALVRLRHQGGIRRGPHAIPFLEVIHTR